MQMKTSRALPKNIFSLLFAFGLVVIASYITTDLLFFSNQHEKLAMDNAINKTNFKKTEFQRFFHRNDATLYALSQSHILKEFIQHKREITDVESLFKTTAHATPNIFQLRYIDHLGNEQIRIQRLAEGEAVFITPKEYLQNKRNRYYFKALQNKTDSSIWYSKLDLNMEKGEIQTPYVPVLRSAIPIHREGEFAGFIIINFFMTEFLNEYFKMPLYKTTLLDNEGYILWHKDPHLRWSQQLGTPNLFQDESIPKIIQQNLFQQENFVSRHLDLPIDNSPILVLQLQDHYLSQQWYQQLKQYLVIALIVLVVITILSYLLNRTLKQFGLDFATSRLNEKLFKSTFDQAAAGVAHISLDGRWLKANQKMTEILGYSELELKKMTIQDVTYKNDSDSGQGLVNCLQQKPDNHYHTEKRCIRKNGHVIWVNLTVSMLHQTDGSPDFFIYLIQDISDRKKTEENLAKLMHDMGERMKELKCIYAATEIARRSQNIDLLLKEIVKVLPAGWHYPESTRARIVYKNRQFDSEPFEETKWRQASNLTVAGELVGLVEIYYLKSFPNLDEGPFLNQERTLINNTALIISEAIERIQTQQKLQHLASHDPLTGLMNRQSLTAYIESEIAKSNRHNRALSVVLLDLDHFKNINDTHGHLTGDQVLVSFAQLLTHEIRESDQIVRYGGEEFLMLLPETTIDEACQITQRIISKAANLTIYSSLRAETRFTVSAGIATFPEHGLDWHTLVHHADEALYSAKQNGRNQLQVFMEAPSESPKHH